MLSLTCDWWPNSQGNRAQTEQKSDGLRGARGPDDVISDGPEQRDEASIEEAHDKSKDYQRLVDKTLV